MSWIIEKDLLVSQKIHIDNDFMQTLLRRIDELELELASHTRQVRVLENQVISIFTRETCGGNPNTGPHWGSEIRSFRRLDFIWSGFQIVGLLQWL